jgi:O-antigen/teichoic acid export membrane protein
VLFRDGRAPAAAANDGLWVLVMAAVTPVMWVVGTSWALVAAWAFGGFSGALLGVFQTRLQPARPVAAGVWWRAELWPLGRWLGASSLIDSVCSYALLLLLALIIGTSALGGLNAVTTIFTPLSVIASAIALPGLPALARARLASERAALGLALRLGLVSTGLTVLYVGLLSIGGGSVVPRIFGHSFSKFTDLVWPVGIGQVLAASAVGTALLLKAQRRGKAVLLSDSAAWAVALGAAAGLGAIHGVAGAAWGLAAGMAVSAGAKTVLAFRLPIGTTAQSEAARPVVSSGLSP